MHSGGRKRVVSSCAPCYRKKQKCNRRYPCNQCTRRRQPEDCIYNTSQASQGRRTDNCPVEDNAVENDAHSQGISGNEKPVGMSSDWRTIRGGRKNLTVLTESNSLAELFAHVEHSEYNTIALVRRLGLDESDDQNGGNSNVPKEASDEIQRNIQRLPGREALDFLVQYYVTEVYWMEQVVFAPWFLGQYQKWWMLGRLSIVHHVEFAVLFLRICAYSSQFLPSPSYTIDRIRGMPLNDIRSTCHDVAETLAAICERMNAQGTLLRVQHLSVLSLQWQCEGRINASWEAISKAARVAQRIGLHRGRTASIGGLHTFDKEMRSRVYCNLYILDSLLARQLECEPFLATCLTNYHLPRTHSAPSSDGGGPDGFTERLLQRQLADFWRRVAPRLGTTYEAMEAEERYDKFCRELLAELPPAFALTEPSHVWDKELPRLPLQRQMFHLAIFESIYQNFRPVLLSDPGQVLNLPAYKQVLLASQQHTLAFAALKTLDCVSNLHTLLGRSHTRFPNIIMPTFEAAVVLCSLVMDTQFLRSPSIGSTNANENLSLENEQKGHVDPLVWERAHVTRESCRRAIQDALARLEMLAEVSNMAKICARTLARLIAKMPVLVSSNGGGSYDTHAALHDIELFRGDGDVSQAALLDLDHFFATCSTESFSGVHTALPD